MSVDLSKLFGRDRDILIGMVHVAALPGTAGSAMSPAMIVSQAVSEAIMLAEAGFDAVMLENMHDTPYMLRSVGPEITACMTRVTSAVRAAIDLPLGVQILAGANRDAMAVAHASDAQFIRAEGFCFSTVADEGLMAEADAGPLLRYRRAIDAEHVAVLADIRKKHSSHAITQDLTIEDWAHGAEFMGADGVIVTGSATGAAAAMSEVTSAAEATELPVFIGSGITAESLAAGLHAARGVIVGSSLKCGGVWQAGIDEARAEAMAKARDAACQSNNR
jgi:membrane complex biogenesis BtpA family protein